MTCLWVCWVSGTGGCPTTSPPPTNPGTSGSITTQRGPPSPSSRSTSLPSAIPACTRTTPSSTSGITALKSKLFDDKDCPISHMRVLMWPIKKARSWRYWTGSWRQATPFFIVILSNIRENETIMLKCCLFH